MCINRHLRVHIRRNVVSMVSMLTGKLASLQREDHLQLETP